MTPISLQELSHDLAAWLTERLAEYEGVGVVGPFDKGETIVVMRPGGDHLMIQVNHAELVIR